jgi:hypothetical protein
VADEVPGLSRTLTADSTRGNTTTLITSPIASAPSSTTMSIQISWKMTRSSFSALAGDGELASHFVDVSDTIELGVASPRKHSVYIEGLGHAFDPDAFLKDMGGYGGMAAGCAYAVLLQSYSV